MSYLEEDFRRVSFDYLLRRAEELLFQYESVNQPLLAVGAGVLPAKSRVSISASVNGQLAFNFCSRAVQAMLLDAVPEADAIGDELGHRVAGSHVWASRGRNVCEKLNREVDTYLDSLRLTGALDVAELRDFLIESVRSPLAPTRP